MKNLAIIPARSGSKGLKDKNIKKLHNKPLIAYTIEAALNSNEFSHVMVSTDSENYAKIAKKYGAEVPFLRNEILSNDDTSSWDVVKDVLKWFNKKGDYFDTVTLLQPTSPLRSSEDISRGFELFKSKNAKAVISVCEADHSPLWSNTLPENFSLKEFISESVIKKPRQQLQRYYRLNGAIYIIDTNYLNQGQSLYSDNCFALLMAKENSIDIDDIFDFATAEAFLNLKKSSIPFGEI